MSNWIDELKSDVQKELAGKPIVATLATVQLTDQGPEADARNIVVRQITGIGQLLIVSDGRSQKNHQLKENSSAAVVIWFPKLRKQFRVSGSMRIISGQENDPRRVKLWNELSDSARALFYWPACGEVRREGEEFVKQIPREEPIPESFEVLQLSAGLVETLDLNPHPHLRVRWASSDGQWTSAIVNP